MTMNSQAGNVSVIFKHLYYFQKLDELFPTQNHLFKRAFIEKHRFDIANIHPKGIFLKLSIYWIKEKNQQNVLKSTNKLKMHFMQLGKLQLN